MNRITPQQWQRACPERPLHDEPPRLIPLQPEPDDTGLTALVCVALAMSLMLVGFYVVAYVLATAG